MGVLDKFKSRIGGDQEDRQFGHQCEDCGREFESPEQNSNEVVCPDCGSDWTHTVA